MKSMKLATVLAVLALMLVGCITVDRNDGDSDTTQGGSSSTGRHNDADVTFAQDMIPHHAQAIMMSAMAKQQARSPRLRRLAADIQADQRPEIEQMSRWLEAWGEDGPRGLRGMGDDGDYDMGDMSSMMDGGDMPGMMTGRQMTRLDRASESAFDTMWLQMMIQHHEGAIEMAEVEQREGSSRDAIELARAIESSQTAEIALMKSMLKP